MDEEDSQILKLIRDPIFPKLTNLVLALFQLIIFTTGNFYGVPALSIIVSMLTLLTSYAHFTYTIAFACLNLMTIPATLYEGRCALAAILGLILMAVYLVEAYKAITQIGWHRWENIDEDPRKYVRFLKFIARFPVFTNLLIAILSVGLIVVAWLRLSVVSYGYRNDYDSSYNYSSYYDSSYYDSSYYSDYYYMTWDKFTMFFAIGFLLVFSLMNIMTMEVMCIQSKLNINRYKIKYTFTLIKAVIAFVGFTVSFGNMAQFPIIILAMAVVFVLSLFMALSEAHAKCDEPSSDNRNSILPKSLPKNILNPVVSNELKVGLDGDTPKI
uniref:Uncharacterized protein n=1 Tax=Acrobeloides nanus TaxID=290746 RepID=A0A914E027_9BILA